LIQRTFCVDRVEPDADEPRYNIAPSQGVWAVVKDDNKRLVRLRWGLVPFWAKDPGIGNRLINARAESVETKPAFRGAFRKRRCLIVADGFYEWKGRKGRKQPFYLTLAEAQPFGFAGLWELWRNPQSGEELRSCAILTTDAAQSIKDIHDRMPVVLKSEFRDGWLDPGAETGRLKQMLFDGVETDFRRRPVSRHVNRVQNDDPQCIEEAAPQD
jgi:putative SOS response-associated peptidase YedK